MAENEIDKLSLSIKVKDNNSAKKILQVSNAIRNLTNSLKGLDAVSDQLKTLQSVFAGIGAIGSKAKNIATGNDVLKKASMSESSKTGSLPSIGSGNKITAETSMFQPLSETAKEVDFYFKQLQDGTRQVVQVYEDFQDGVKRTITVVNGAVKSVKNLDNAQKEVGEKTKKTTGFFGSFIKSIGRIALYRAIRTALKEITQAFTEGIQNYARYDKATNEAMSKIMNSTNQLKNTLGVSLGSVLQSLAPLLESLIDKTVDFVNNINMALASLQGKDTYSKAIKQNEDYAKSLDKVNGKLLSFDTFNTLATSNGSKGLFEEVATPEELNKTAQSFKDIIQIITVIGEAVIQIIKDVTPLIKDALPILKNVLDAVAKIVRQILPLVIQIVRPILELIEPLVEVISLLVDALMPAIEQIVDMITDAIDWLVPLIKSILNNLSGLIKLVTGDWEGAIESFKNFFINTWKFIANIFASIINGIVNAFITFVNILIDGLNLIAKPINLIGRWVFGKGENFAQIGHWKANFNWTPYANGGGFNAGDAFIAGERGAELVASSNRGGAVMNMEQLQSAIYNGMILAMAQDGGKEIVLKVDNNTLGRVVANSTGFISETNRRNASLKLV